MKKLKQLFFPVLLFFVIQACAPTGFVKKKGGILEHQFTGIDFPEKIGNFQRTPVKSYDALGRNVGVGYILRSETCHTSFTMYLYPRGDLTLGDEFDNIKQSILQIYENVETLSEAKAYYLQDSTEVQGLTATFRIPARMEGQKFYLLSQAHLFEHDGNFIKYRVTYPEVYRSCTERELAFLLKNLEWDFQ